MKTNFIFNKLNIFIAFVFFISFSNILLAQSKQEGYQIEGAIYDKNTKQPVPNATVSIQKINSKEILEYQFTSQNGSFKIMGKTAMNDSLELQISHVNFEPLIQKLDYGKIIKGLVLDSIYLNPKSNSIEEVVVDGPPIFLRKDTLIINPNAFNLKENAVMEDVLSKVPGIVLWSDGKITVNGKTVSEILVNGKPFFGGDPVVAVIFP
ncbi:carboxypeptidase-like regulatory domain-containing protein [Sphingobacterium sp. WM]|uniref:carboxypeptidase-like regulatory domain-containing protein n=1 Tax=Sphingobacterium sp. WM TaxID=3031802 RepID=UPI00240E1F45|nr:carboxypeptidase-like regulatory domain-containing protein [Sphingobacterium sp. WM]WFB64985.1 carboxypeptidase-like regulatory domain-containing protein [Sphingobacterium sp. WM]